MKSFEIIASAALTAPALRKDGGKDPAYLLGELNIVIQKTKGLTVPITELGSQTTRILAIALTCTAFRELLDEQYVVWFDRAIIELNQKLNLIVAESNKQSALRKVLHNANLKGNNLI